MLLIYLPYFNPFCSLIIILFYFTHWWARKLWPPAYSMWVYLWNFHLVHSFHVSFETNVNDPHNILLPPTGLHQWCGTFFWAAIWLEDCKSRCNRWYHVTGNFLPGNKFPLIHGRISIILCNCNCQYQHRNM